MSKWNLVRIAILSSVVLALTSCGSGDSSPKAATENLVKPPKDNGNTNRGGGNNGSGNNGTGTGTSQTSKSDYGMASCEYKHDQGNAALSTLPEVTMYESYFDKQIDSNLLFPLLTASATETVRFAQLAGVNIYSVSAFEYNSCLMLAFIPAAPIKYSTAFTKAGSSVLGLYLPAKNNFLEKMNETPVIMVRKDANRWVLVHEIMHHLFSKEVQSQKNDDVLKAEVQSSINNFMTAEGAYKKSKSIEDGKKLLANIKLVSEALPELLKRFMLEEVTIEALLSELLNEKLLAHIPVNQAINGAAYIFMSAKKAQPYFDILESLNSDSDGIIRELNLLLPADQQLNTMMFKKSKDSVQKNIETMNKLKRLAEKRLLAAGINPLNLMIDAQSSKTHSHGELGCARSGDADQVLENAKQALLNRQSNK